MLNIDELYLQGIIIFLDPLKKRYVLLCLKKVAKFCHLPLSKVDVNDRIIFQFSCLESFAICIGWAPKIMCERWGRALYFLYQNDMDGSTTGRTNQQTLLHKWERRWPAWCHLLQDASYYCKCCWYEYNEWCPLFTYYFLFGNILFFIQPMISE